LTIRKEMGVVGERMVWELRGVSCLKLEEPQPRKNIAKSRSFGRVITEKEEIAEALASFVTIACEKLRKQESYANALSVFLEFKDDTLSSTRRHCSMVKAFDFPTNDTPQMIKAAKALLSKLFIEKKRYKKCGVILLDLITQAAIMPDLFVEGSTAKRKALMHTVDALNARFGKNTIVFGPRNKNPKWKMRSERHSKHSTTDWDALPIVKA
jgi:DNA polymerase V